jgi:hypothetical protein
MTVDDTVELSERAPDEIVVKYDVVEYCDNDGDVVDDDDVVDDGVMIDDSVALDDETKADWDVEGGVAVDEETEIEEIVFSDVNGRVEY